MIIRRNIKCWVILFGAIHLFSGVKGQQDNQYSQYMFNTLVLNPAVAGSNDLWVGNFVFRKQWVGIPGSPLNASLSFHGQNGQNHGFGGLVVNEQLGITNKLNLNFNYAYRLKISELSLAMGLRLGVMNYFTNWSKARLGNPEPGVIPEKNTMIFLPIAGPGVYLHHERFFVGLSIPNMIKNKLNTLEPSGQMVARQVRHMFIEAGGSIWINEQLELLPSFIVKMAENSPISFDLNLGVLLRNSLYLGGSYRHQDAIIILLGYELRNGIKFGYAYDFPISKLLRVSSGSHEFMVGFRLQKEITKIRSPRFF